jgi:hypothetical protein
VVPEQREPEPEATAAPQPARAHAVGSRVRLAGTLRYLKTADPMPMLRPPDLVDGSEVGLVCEVRPRDQLAVRFRRGTFLVSAADLTAADG